MNEEYKTKQDEEGYYNQLVADHDIDGERPGQALLA